MTEVIMACGNRAAAPSFNVCPYLTISSFRYRPQVLGSIEVATILTQSASGERIGGDRFPRVEHFSCNVGAMADPEDAIRINQREKRPPGDTSRNSSAICGSKRKR